MRSEIKEIGVEIRLGPNVQRRTEVTQVGDDISTEKEEGRRPKMTRVVWYQVSIPSDLEIKGEKFNKKPIITGCFETEA